MSGDPTLNDEELAEMERWNDALLPDQHIPQWRVSRLITALRASRDEGKQLRSYINANPMRACYEEAEAERDELQFEVERLTQAVAVRMTVPEPMIRVPNPVFEAVVERRARQLCARAEPHEVEERCHVHESEARRQLVDQWQDQSHEESRL